MKNLITIIIGMFFLISFLMTFDLSSYGLPCFDKGISDEMNEGRSIIGENDLKGYKTLYDDDGIEIGFTVEIEGDWITFD